MQEVLIPALGYTDKYLQVTMPQVTMPLVPQPTLGTLNSGDIMIDTNLLTLDTDHYYTQKQNGILVRKE